MKSFKTNMIQHILHIFIRRTHFWRTVSVSEMAELYTSRVLRVMAMNMLGGFGAVYFYQLGYSLQFLAWFYVFLFGTRFLSIPLVVVIVARYGPKHSISISNLLFILAVLVLAATPILGIWTFLLMLPFGGFGRGLYDTAYLVDFSKVKHIEHSGKEIGLMQIIERFMTAAAPVMGGFIALLFGPSAMMIFAGVLMLVSASPLFFTSEPVKIHQKITLRHFNFKNTWKLMVAQIGVGADNNGSGLIWNIFVALVVLGAVNNAVYLKIGILSSVSLVASIAISYIYGKIVDKNSGIFLLKLSSIGNFLLYVFRPLISTPLQVASMNIANEFATTGYNIPATRGIFNTADGLPGYRVVFIAVMVSMLAVGDVLASLVLVVLTTIFSDVDALKNYYLVLAPLMLLILFHSSAIYRRGILTRFIHHV
ncbi:MFS transporter [Candidatus Saccharibacteria bacterium]|nr:MFS transporter [Candidatus Saccharibacteria bacterium]